MSSSMATGGRTYSIRSLVGGESVPSVTSNGSRSGRASRRSRSDRAGRPAGRGEGRRVRGRARHGGRDGRVVVPGAGLAAVTCRGRRRTGLSLRPFVAVAAAAGTAAAAGVASSSSSAGVRLSDAAAVVPIQRAVPTAGLRRAAGAGSRSATMTPTTASATSRTNGARRREQVGQDAGEGAPDPAAARRPRIWAAPTSPA